ncbi:MAG: ABC transporter ATP-binding protein [Anaerolineae bacterium]|nr:ABC transporter ATP-binding protein [Anaerolineae bacterium]
MKSLRRILPFMQPYGWVITIGILTTVLTAAMELTVPRLLQYVIDQGIRVGSMTVIIRGSGIMFAAALVGAVAILVQGVCRAQLSQGIAFDLRNQLFTYIQGLSFGNLDRMQTGRLMTRISSDVDVVRMFASAGILLLLRAGLMVIGSVILIVLTDWRLSIIMFVILILAGLVIRSIIGVASPLFINVQQKLSALNTLAQENLAGVRVIKAFVREQFEIERFNARSTDYMQQYIKVGRLIAVALPVLTLLTNLGSVAVIWFGGLDVIGGRLTVGQLVAFNNYLMIGMAPLMLLGNMLTMATRAEASAARVMEVLDAKPLIQAALSPHRADSVRGHVVFENVSFHYNGNGGEAVLDDVSFEVKPGQRVALLGATGSGKSTLVNLIPRFYDVTGGQIRLDGIDVRQWSPEALRLQIGMVLQQTTLFSGTIRENIAYGRPEATLEQVITAAQAAQAHEFIMAMPAGYDSLVEARGANLSGGQRQRVAIARALLISPGILILDDSTSAVDMDTEFKIQQALDELMRERTTFIIAQRITSVLNADQIFILDSGRIVARGTHQQLMQISPIYQEIYHSQLGEHNLVRATLTA